jgi:hypothetical protein
MTRIATLLLLYLIGCIGCTPRMHRAYRASMTTLTAATAVVDTRMTMYALDNHSATLRESNPLYGGDRPSDARLMGGLAFSLAWQVSLLPAVNALPDRGPETEWIRDVLVTVPAVINGFVLWHNTGMIGDGMRSW